MLSNEVILQMINSLYELNEATTPNWIMSSNDYRLAAAMEAAEGLNSHGWAWWRPAVTDVNNCRIELIDVWHFLLADLIRERGTVEGAVPSVERAINISLGASYVFSAVESWRVLMVDAGSSRSYKHLANLRNHYGMDDQLFTRLFFCKCELNRMRQVNGYKNSSYIKMWLVDGKRVEDNEKAAAISANYDFLVEKQVQAFRVRLQGEYLRQVALCG